MTTLGAAAAGLAGLAGISAEAAAQHSDHPHGQHFLQCAKACFACHVQCWRLTLACILTIILVRIEAEAERWSDEDRVGRGREGAVQRLPQGE